MNRLPYNLANQRSHIGQMGTIATILIGVISLLGKRSKLTCEVFWLEENTGCVFPAKKSQNEHWEVVCGQGRLQAGAPILSEFGF